MDAAKGKFDKRSLGRCPAKGRVSFKTGPIPTLKDRLRNRNSKPARNFLRRQLGQK